MASNSAPYTQGFNFGNLLQKGVDPRTGQYNCAINLWEAPSDVSNCPPFKLTLSFNPLTLVNLGLGEGWSFNLTSYTQKGNTLNVSTGESFKVRESPESVTLLDQKLQSCKFQKVATDYRVVHKSGQLEVLRNGNNIFNKHVPYEVYAANGRSLKLSWTSKSGNPRLLKIQEGSRDLIKVDYDSSPPRIIRFPNTVEEGVFRFRLQNNRMTSLILPLDDYPTWKFGYEQYGKGLFIQQLVSPTGLVESMKYNSPGHRLPPGAPMISIPYVSKHTEKPGNSQPSIVTTYKFSDHNYMGYGGVSNWQDGEDNLYRTSGDYQYWSEATVDQAATTRNTYNHFHLLISSEHKKGTATVTEEIAYYAKTPGRFVDQVPQFQLPKTITRTYKDGNNPESRLEVTHQEYDEWGNPTKEVQPDKLEIHHTYYPAEGEESRDSGDNAFGCPPDPHGFKRYMKTETVIPAPSEYAAPTRTKKYRYGRIVTAEGAPVEYFVTAQQQLGLDDTQILTRTTFEYVDQPTTRAHGMLASQITSHLGQYASSKSCKYPYSDDRNELTLKTRTTTFDNLAVEEERVYSTLSGLTRTHKDQTGVEDHFDYSLLGQIVMVTTSPGTRFEAVRKYNYSFLEEGKGNILEVTDVKGLITRYISDGLGRRCRVEKQDPDWGNEFRVVSKRNYNAQGQCWETSEMDWVMDKDGKPSSCEVTQQIEYDDWGQVSKSTESTGLITHTFSDIIKRSTETGIEGEGTIKTWHNEAGRPTQTAFYKADGSLYSTKKCRYDGLNRLVEEGDQLGRVTKYTSDSFDRIIATNWSAGRTATTTYDEHSEAKLPASVSVNGIALGQQQFDGLGRMHLRTVGPRVTAQTFYGASMEPNDVRNEKGLVTTMEYEPALQYAPTKMSWGADSYSFTYDPQTGLPTEMKGMYNRQTREYLSSGILHSETFDVQGEESFSASYRFSLAGRLQQYTNPHDQTQTLAYDEFGRLDNLSQDRIMVSFQYDNSSRLEKYKVKEQEKGSILSTTLTYDDFGRESTRQVQKGEETLFIQSQDYNETGLIKSRTVLDGRSTSPVRAEAFSYDDRNRLCHYTCKGHQAPSDEQGRQLQSQSFVFDDFDNVVQRTTVFQDETQNITEYLYDLPNPTRLLHILNTHVDYPRHITLEYDTHGRLTKDEQGRQLEYDTFGRLIRVHDTNNKTLCEYRYDASGKLVCQLIPDKPDTHLFYREESLIASKTGERRTSYISDGKACWGQIVQDKESLAPNIQLWAADGHDSVLARVDGHAPDEVHYEAYTPYGFGAESSIGFNGQWRDPVTGWYHLGNGYRVYNPVLMRFHCPDPWSPFTSGETNPYAYCLGDPINRLDPSGHFSFFGIEFNWRTLTTAIVGLVASIAVGVLTGGASLAVQVAVGAVVGGITSAAAGALGDLADGHNPSLESVGIDFGFGFVGGGLAPLGDRAFGGIKGWLRGVRGFAPVSYNVSAAINNSVWRLGLQKHIAGYGLKTLVKDSTKGSIRTLLWKEPLKWVGGAAMHEITKNKGSDSPQPSSSSSSGGESQIRQPEPVTASYLAPGSALPRDSIRPLLKDGSNAFSGYTLQAAASSMSSSYGAASNSGQSIAEALNLSFRSSYASSTEDQGSHYSDLAVFGSISARIRASPGEGA